MFNLDVQHQGLLISISLATCLTGESLTLFSLCTFALALHDRLQFLLPLLVEALDFCYFFGEGVELVLELQEVLLADFVQEEAFPELVVVVGVGIVGLAVGRGEAEVLTEVGLAVGFEPLYSFEDLGLDLGDLVVELGLELIWSLPFL